MRTFSLKTSTCSNDKATVSNLDTLTMGRTSDKGCEVLLGPQVPLRVLPYASPQLFESCFRKKRRRKQFGVFSFKVAFQTITEAGEKLKIFVSKQCPISCLWAKNIPFDGLLLYFASFIAHCIVLPVATFSGAVLSAFRLVLGLKALRYCFRVWRNLWFLLAE